jgi:hypothetical protein
MGFAQSAEKRMLQKSFVQSPDSFISSFIAQSDDNLTENEKKDIRNKYGELNFNIKRAPIFPLSFKHT